MSRSWSSSVLQWAVVVHRWLGIPMSLLFVLWFASGAVMLFVAFPSLSDADRLRGARLFSAEDVEVSPAEALPLARGGDRDVRVESLRLVGRGADAVQYVAERVSGESKSLVTIDAATGMRLAPMETAEAELAAASFSESIGLAPAALSLEGPFDYDQWVVHQRFDLHRPFFRVTRDDTDRRTLYVSSATGEVVQWTTARQRFWNYPGSVAHWIYPTLIRRNWALWDQLVWWLSLAGIVVAALGLWVGVARLRYRSELSWPDRISPFKSWLKWHHTLGVVAGVFVLTWIFSGWLSMDHGRLFDVLEPPHEPQAKYLGATLEAAIARTTENPAWEGPGAEVEFLRFDGELLVVARTAEGRSVFGFQNDGRTRRLQVAEARMHGALERAWGFSVSSSGSIAEDDAYGRLLEAPLPPSAIRFEIADPAATWVHVDRDTGQILEVMTRSRRAYRWLYNGLHSLDLPYLAKSPSLRRGIILTLLLLGMTLSATSLVVGLKRLARSRLS